jgi:DNA-binding LytR/AlgR family response regulator
VFVTAFDQFAVEAFEREAMDYLLKPVDDQRLGRTIARLRSSLAAPPAVPPEALLARLRDLLAGSHGYAHLFRQM